MICEATAILGIDPGPWTLRELAKMARTVQEIEWSRTASLMSLIEVVHSGAKRRPKFNPNKWNPLADRKSRGDRDGTKITKQNIGALKMFVTGKGQRRRAQRKPTRRSKRKDPQK